MVRIFICDSDIKWQKSATEILEAYALKQDTDIVIYCFDGLDAMLDNDGPAPDMLFIDIEFRNDGSVDSDVIEAVKEVNRLYPECQVVYMADSLTYAPDVYQTIHIWFVLKEQLADWLPEIVDKYELIDRERKSDLIIRTTSGSSVRIPCRQIMYIERKGRKTIIVTYREIYEVRERIPDVFDKLPPGRFARCHNSFVVNMEKIREIQTKNLFMRNGKEIMISRGYSKGFKNEYSKWAKKKTVK